MADSETAHPESGVKTAWLTSLVRGTSARLPE